MLAARSALATLASTERAPGDRSGLRGRLRDELRPFPEPMRHTLSFTTTAAVPLPTFIGSATLYADGTMIVRPSPSLGAFIRTTRFEVFVDGASVGTTPYGVVAGGGDIDVILRPYGVYIASGIRIRPRWYSRR